MKLKADRHKQLYQVRMSIDGLIYRRSFKIKDYGGWETAKAKATEFANKIDKIRKDRKREYQRKLKDEMEILFDGELA